MIAGTGRRPVSQQTCRLTVVLLGMGVLAIGCDRIQQITTGHKTTPDPNSKNITSVDLLHDPAFSFRYSDGSGWMGCNMLTVDAAGHCEYVFLSEQRPGAQIWKRATFDCDSKTLSDLRQLLHEMKVTELPREYDDTRIQDGHQRILDVTLTGYKKDVYWNNWFPSSNEKIDAFVNGRILQVQTSAIGRALPTSRPIGQ